VAHDLSRRAGLEQHHAHRVGYQVVQLARDPRPLGSQRCFPLSLQAIGSLGQCHGALLAAAHRASC
jgi:hypothetical protein